MRDDKLDIDFLFLPYFEVGGDFADFFRLPDGMLCLYLGDVVARDCPPRFMERW